MERSIVLLPYSSEPVTKIKRWLVAGSIKQDTRWTVSQTNEAVTHLLALFAGELDSLRHSFPHLSWKRLSIQTVQDPLGQTDVQTIMINANPYITPVLCWGYSVVRR